MLQILLSGVQLGFILGSLLFNIFINNLFYFIKDAQLLNFADDKTITIFSNSVDGLITKLQKESENDRLVSLKRNGSKSRKFQPIVINWLGKLKNS